VLFDYDEGRKQTVVSNGSIIRKLPARPSQVKLVLNDDEELDDVGVRSESNVTKSQERVNFSPTFGNDDQRHHGSISRGEGAVPFRPQRSSVAADCNRRKYGQRMSMANLVDEVALISRPGYHRRSTVFRSAAAGYYRPFQPAPSCGYVFAFFFV
jgi:hypothetical protein